MGVLQSGVLSFLSNLLTSNEDLEYYVKMFESIDKGHDGFITINEIKESLSDSPAALG
jgi:Ca2+-binding EF-hand superfamily protein